MWRKEDCEGERRHGVAEKRVAKAKRETRRCGKEGCEGKRRGNERAANAKLRAGDEAGRWESNKKGPKMLDHEVEKRTAKPN